MGNVKEPIISITQSELISLFDRLELDDFIIGFNREEIKQRNLVRESVKKEIINFITQQDEESSKSELSEDIMTEIEHFVDSIECEVSELNSCVRQLERLYKR